MWTFIWYLDWVRGIHLPIGFEARQLSWVLKLNQQPRNKGVEKHSVSKRGEKLKKS